MLTGYQMDTKLLLGCLLGKKVQWCVERFIYFSVAIVDLLFAEYAFLSKMLAGFLFYNL